jgi:hypothetical protein
MKYEKEVTCRVKEMMSKIDKAKKTNEDVKIVKKLFPSMIIWVDTEVNCSVKVNSMDEVKEMLKTFAKNGIMLDRLWKGDANPVWYLKGKNTPIRLAPIWPDAAEQGATCRIVQVGEETVTYPKYKLICDGKVEDEIA